MTAFVRPGDERWMREALRQATLAGEAGEVPVGACVVADHLLIAAAGNAMRGGRDATQHAELRVLRAAMKAREHERLDGCTLYVTLEPCVMCAGAVVNGRVGRLVYGATDPKAGAVESLYHVCADERLNHRPPVEGGVLADECGQLLKSFFAERRR